MFFHNASYHHIKKRLIPIFVSVDITYINGIEIFISKKYMENTYKSCSRVAVPSTGELALDLMCGNWGASKCSPSKWFGYMGDADNPFVPFQIVYTPIDGIVNDVQPLDPVTIPCNQALNVSVK